MRRFTVDVTPEGDTPAPEHPELVYVGQHAVTGERWSEEFRLAVAVPQDEMLPVMQAIASDAKVTFAVFHMRNMIRALLLDDESRTRWDALMNDPARQIKAEDFALSMEWIVEELFEIPFGLQSASPTPPGEGATSGATSEDESSGTATPTT